MDITALPFDAEEMLAGLRPWIECESPTWDAAAVNRMMDLASHDLATMGAQIERIPGCMGLGGSVRARFRTDQKGLVHIVRRDVGEDGTGQGMVGQGRNGCCCVGTLSTAYFRQTLALFFCAQHR